MHFIYNNTMSISVFIFIWSIYRKKVWIKRNTKEKSTSNGVTTLTQHITMLQFLKDLPKSFCLQQDPFSAFIRVLFRDYNLLCWSVQPPGIIRDQTNSL